MPNYQNGKIYKLWSPQGGYIYIGSTTHLLAVRKAEHKRKNSCSSKILFEKYDDVRIELIEEYPCKNKMELNRREGEHIRNNDCVNKLIAGRTKKEYREDNKENISEKLKEWRENNKDYNLNYYTENKEKIAEKHKEKLKEKITCECGCEVSKINLSTHKKTKKHIKLMSSIKT